MFGFAHDDLDLAVRELASELAHRDMTVDLHLVGGAAIVLGGLGRTFLTADIDAHIPDAHARDRVLRCADVLRGRHPDWPEAWFNDEAESAELFEIYWPATR